MPPTTGAPVESEISKQVKDVGFTMLGEGSSPNDIVKCLLLEQNAVFYELMALKKEVKRLILCHQLLLD